MHSAIMSSAVIHQTAVAADDNDAYLRNSIFVANLCQSLTNPELACALHSLFRPFGALKSIKASRDAFGRPFGFIEFYEAEACRLALAQNMMLELGGRPLRMERARRQLKLLLKYTGEHPTEQKKRLDSVVCGQHRMSILQDQTGVSAIVRVDKACVAKELHQKFSKLLPEQDGWKISWMNGDETGVSSIRSSGLVHLVFPPEDSQQIPGLLSVSPLLIPPILTTMPSPEPLFYTNHKVLMDQKLW